MNPIMINNRSIIMNKQCTRYFSNKQEKHVAKAVGGKQTANSGATMFSKGDVTLSDWLLECKTKTSPSQSISIKKEWLEKNEEEAFNKANEARLVADGKIQSFYGRF